MLTVLLLALSACSNSTNSEKPVLPVLTGTITINHFIKVGAPVTVNTDNLEGTGTIKYEWQTSDTASGTFVPVSGATLASYTPITNNEGLYLRAEVSRTGNSGAVTSNAVMVQPESALPPEVTGVTVTPANASIARGWHQQFEAEVNGSNLTLEEYKAVKWTVSGGHGSTAISTGGLLTVDANESSDSLTVKAVSALDNTKYDEAAVTLYSIGLYVTTWPSQTSYGIGEPFNPEGMVINFIRGDEDPEIISNDDPDLEWNNSFSAGAGGGKTVTISYQGFDTEVTDLTVLSLVDRIKAVLGTEAEIVLYADEALPPHSIGGDNALPADTKLTLRGSGAVRTITHAAAGYFFYVNPGAELILAGNLTFNGSGVASTLIWVNGAGRLVMKSGVTITGATSSSGAIHLYEGAIFDMEGGAITNNHNTSSSGGGIQNINGTFTMTGGTITGNSALDGGGLFSSQGNVYLRGGSITGNTATNYGDDMSTYYIQTMELSGSMEIGNIALCAASSTIDLDPGYTNGVLLIDLLNNNNNLASIKNTWLNQRVILPAGGTIDPALFPLGKFYTHDGTESEDISNTCHLDSAGYLVPNS